jgi:hypothetical protein
MKTVFLILDKKNTPISISLVKPGKLLSISGRPKYALKPGETYVVVQLKYGQTIDAYGY